ncbi:MAG: PfkB family carbohydrate kinase [Candidatus Zixiibacteriota bacterium]
MLAFGNPVYDSIRTPWVSTRDRVLSGCATNAALAYRKLGGDAMVVGRVGADRLDHYRATFDRLGIAHDTEPCAESGGFGLDYDAQGRRELTLLGRADPVQRVPASVAKADIVFIGPVLQETPFELIRKVRRQTDATMVLDPQGLLRRVNADGRVEHFKPEGIEDLCASFDIVKPNELETEILTGVDPRQDLERAAAILVDWGIPTVVITLADLGALIVTEGRWHRISAIPTLAVDSTGAGDTFAAGLMYALTTGRDWAEAGRLATAVSSIMIEQCGPEFELTLAEAERRARTVTVETRNMSTVSVS